jgi:hypothetical protein
MDMPRLSKSVRRVTVLNRDGQGSVQALTLYKKGRKRKKVTRAFKPLERMARRFAAANDRAASTYFRRYKKSNRKRRDGWLREMPENMLRSGSKALRKLDPIRLFTL